MRFLGPLFPTAVPRWFALAALAASLAPLGRSQVPPPPPPRVAAPAHPLVWDDMQKVHHAKPGEERASYVFSVANRAAHAVEIMHVQPSCGCTVADLPEKPWILAPGATGSFTATLDFKGKTGRVAKTMIVESSHGNQTLTVAVEIPEPDHATRVRNQELARANRQLVFQNDCASCHAAPLAGKTGAELFGVACGICHLAAERAAIVPDLHAARETRDEAYWRKWISEGKEGTLMPAFAKSRGGPLDDPQIDSLVAYLVKHFATTPTSPPTPAGD